MYTKYIITVKHDTGKQNIKVMTSLGIQNAIEAVCKAESCPERAVINVK